METTFPVFTIRGEAFERGCEYGRLCKGLIEERIRILRTLVDREDYFGISWEKAIEKAKIYRQYIERYDPEIIEEMNGIADGADLKPDVVLFLNVVYEFFSLKVDGVWSGCTTVAVLPEMTRDKNTLIGQNDDWNEAFQQVSILLRIKPKAKPDIIQFTDAGTVGGNGCNSSGVGLCANSLLSDGWSMKGVPHLVIKRGILSSTNLSDAIGSITAHGRCSSHNYLLAHVDGEAVDIEATPYTANVTFATNGFLTHTNHFAVPNPRITDNKVLRSPDSLVRKHRADKIISSQAEPVSVETIKLMFRDHFSKPHSICRHPDPRVPKMRQMQTNASMIIDMTNSRMQISRGPPCTNNYHEVEMWK